MKIEVIGSVEVTRAFFNYKKLTFVFRYKEEVSNEWLESKFVLWDECCDGVDVLLKLSISVKSIIREKLVKFFLDKNKSKEKVNLRNDCISKILEEGKELSFTVEV